VHFQLGQAVLASYKNLKCGIVGARVPGKYSKRAITSTTLTIAGIMMNVMRCCRKHFYPHCGSLVFLIYCTVPTTPDGQDTQKIWGIGILVYF
jgi:hypothetical protein